MLTYVLVIVAVAAMLYLSFRVLGGGAPVALDDYRTVLGRLRGFTAARAEELSDALRQAGSGGRAQPDPLVAAATAARKQLSGYQEQLGRLEPDAAGDQLDVLESARSLLSAAIEDLGWACRMIEAGGHADNSGVQRAVAELRGAAAECLDAAGRLLEAGAEAPAAR